jgi:hypothetical protein
MQRFVMVKCLLDRSQGLSAFAERTQGLHHTNEVRDDNVRIQSTSAGVVES